MSDDAQEWRWVGEDGVEKAVTEQELIAELSSESLPHYTLVWKRRWLEWLPAMQVAELGWALPPGRADRAVKARESPSAAQPPAPPLYLYPVIKRRATNLHGDTASPPPIAPPRPGKSDTSNRGATANVSGVRRGAGGPDSRPIEELELDAIAASSPESPVPEAEEGPQSGSEDDTTVISDGDMLSDPGGSHRDVVPERAPFGRRVYSEDDDGDTHVLPSRPPPPDVVYVGPHSPPTSEAPGPTYDENEIPHIPRPPASPTDLSAYARFSPISDEPEMPAAPTAPPRRGRGVYAGAGAAALAGIAGILLVLRGCGEATTTSLEETATSASAAPSGSARAPRVGAKGQLKVGAKLPPDEERPKGPPCNVVTAAMRVADWAEPLVAPTFAPVPGSARLAVGYAQSETYAIGITIDPRTLDRDQVFREFRHEKLVSVVPTSGNGKLHFDVVREGFPLANARVVDAPIPFALGATPFSIARLSKKGDPEPIWALAEADQSTVPRVAALPESGLAIALRRGGKNGKVAVGLLEPSGAKRTELIDVRSEGSFAGTPSIAVNADSLMVTFAARTSPSTPWGIVAALSKLGDTSRKAVRLRVQSGGPGGDRMAPSVGAMGGGRWFVQWTEGSAGNRLARAQVFGPDLTPLSDAVSLSPDGANAGQGVVWSSGDLATVLFYVRNAKSNNELWGISLECPR